MELPDSSLDHTYANSLEGGSLESQNTSVTAVQETSLPGRMSPFGYNRTAIWITSIAFIIFVLVSLIGGIVSVAHHKKDDGSGNSKANDFSVSSLPLQEVEDNQQIQVGQADHLSVNGQLRVNNSLVLAPMSAPSAPTAGQIYFDQATKAPYYYNGTQFISLAPTALPQQVTSIGGAAGVIALGNGLEVNGNQLALSNSILQAVSSAQVNTPRVTSLQGLTGDVNLVAGRGVGISGTTITNNGVVDLVSGSGNLVISRDSNGNFTITDTATGAGGDVLLAPASAQSDTSSNASLHVDKTGSGNFLQFASNGTDTFVVNQTGQITTGSISYSQVQGAPSTTVTSVGGASGAVTLGSGLNLTGNALSNSGVVSITGTTNQVIASASNGNLTLSLPQDIASTSVPVFGGALLNGGLTVTSGGLLVSGTTSITGTISLNGPTMVSDNLSVQGSNGLLLGVAGTTAGLLRLANASNSNIATIQSAALAQNTVYTLPDPGVGTVGICLTTGNCAGIGGAITGYGTIGHLAKFSASGNVADSGLVESGTSLTYGGNLVVDAANGYTGNLLNLAVNGSSKLSVDQSGNSIQAGTLTVNGSGNSSIAGSLSLGTGLTVTTGGATVSGTVRFSSFGAGLVQSDGTGILSSGQADRNSGSYFSNQLSVMNGGTGTNNLTLNGIVYGNGSGALQSTSSAANSILTTNGSSVPGLTQILPSTVQGNITGTGALTSGSLASGFGGISTTNNITTTAGLQGGSLTVTGGSFTVDASGNIVTTGTTTIQGAGGLSLGVAGTTNGNITFYNSSNSHYTVLQGLAPSGQNQTITIPASTVASDTVCLLSLANCVGAGGAVSVSGGTQYYIPKFTNAGANQLGNSLLYDNGTSVSVGTASPGAGYKLDVNGNVHASGSATIANGLTVTSGGITVGAGGITATGNSTINGTLTSLTGLASSGTVTFSGLGSAGVVQADGSGNLSTGLVALGSETSGSYVANIGTLTGLTTSGNSGAGSTPSLSVNYGSSANTAVEGSKQLTLAAGTGLSGGGTYTLGAGVSTSLAVQYGSAVGTAVQGNTTLTCASGTGNLSGGGNVITLGSGGSCGNVSITNSPVFSGTLAVQGAGGATLGVAGATGGLLNFANAVNTNIGSVKTATLGQATVYNLPDPGTASVDICLSSGNCAGAGGGISGSGTAGKIAKFNSSGSITDSLLSESGSTVTATGSFNATTALQLNGTNINTGGTLSNIAYLDQANSFSAANTFGATGTALSVTNNASIGGTGTIGTLNVTNAATIGTGLTVISGGATITAGGLTVAAGGASVTGNSTIAGTLSSLTGLSSSGAITFSALNSAGVVHTDASGNLSTSSVTLGTDTTGNYIANLGTLTGLTTTGNSGAGSTPTLSVTYGSTANTAAQGNSALSFTGSGNLTGTVSGTAGGGLTTNTLALVNSPTFSGSLTVQGSNALTLGTTGTNTGAIVFKGSTAASGTVILQGPNNPSTSNYTLSIPTLTANDTICTTNTGCGGASGTAGGDLTGTYPNPTIAKLQGTTLTIASIASGDVLQYNGSAVVNGHITNSNLTAGTFTSITGTGALTTGSIGSGFGTISTGNNITTSATVQGGTVNATTALQLGGADINTAGTLSNVAYLNQVQSFTAANTFSAAGTALSVTNNASIGGTGTIGTLSVTNAATIGTGLTVTSGGLTVSAGGANVTGATTIAGNTSVTGANTFSVGTGATSLGGSLGVTGITTLTGALNANGGIATNNANINAGTGTITSGNINGQTISSSANFTGTAAIAGNTTVGGTLGITGAVTGGTYNGQTIGTSSTFTGTLAVQGSNALTLGTTGTNTGAIVFKGSTAASGTVILQGPNNPSTSNYTLSIPTLTANDTICTTNTGCGGASGTAGGDLTGTYPNPTIAKLQGTTLTIASIASGDVLQYNGSAVVNGHITNSNLTAGTFTSITGTGALTTGSIGSGFGTISTGNNITTSATVQGGTVNATTALQLGGADINTAGTLSNVAYLNQANTFSAAQTINSATFGNTIISGGTIGFDRAGATYINATNASGSLQLGAGGANGVLQVTTSQALVQPGSNTAAAFKVVNHAGTTTVLDVDTTNNRVGIGTASPGYTLDVNGTANISGATTLGGTLGVTGITTLTGALNANGGITTNNTNINAGTGTITSGAINGQTISSSANFTGTAAIAGNTTVGGTLGVTGAVTGGTYNGQTISSTANFTGTLAVSGNTTIGGTLGVTGAVTGGTYNGQTISSAANLTGTLSIQGANALTLGTASTNTGAITFKGSGGTGTLTLQGPTTPNTGNYTLSIPTITANDTVCTVNLGNCAGSGGGVTGSGTSGNIAKFNGSGSITNSTLSESGSTVTASGNVVIQGTGSLTLGTASTSTGSIAFKNGTNANTLTLQAGVTGSNFTLTLPTTTGNNGDCLESNGSGVLSFQSCTGGAGGGVTSLDGLAGVLTLNNSSGSGSAVTINDASTSQKGIAQFNSTNFTASSGTVNTAQNINSTATPTFGGETLNGGLTVSSGGASIAGNTSITGTSTFTVGTGATSLGGSLGVTGITTLTGALNANSGITTNNTNINAGTGTITSGAINGQTIGSSSVFTGTVAIQSANALTLGTTGTNTGAIVFKGSTAASGSLTLQGPNNPSASNYILSIPNITANDTICVQSLANCSFSGSTAGGDLTGTYPNPTIAKLQGTTLTISTIASGDILQYNGSAIINGHITNTNLTAGTFSNITGTGALTSGSIGSGFGTISTANSITTTSSVQGNTVNATGTLQLGGNDINTAGTLSNVAYLNASNQSFTGVNTFSRNGTGTGDFTLGVTGAPVADATSSLIRVGSAIASGNNSTNGGTYIGLNEPNTGAGSAADFLNFQVNGVSKLKVTNTGAIVTAGRLSVTSNGGINASGTITFSALNSAGVVHTDASGNLSTSSVTLGTDTTGNYIANLGTLTGLTTTGNSGAGSTPTLSVTYGSTANTAAQGNSALSFTGSGNLTGTVSGTAGGGLTTNTLALVNSPTFSGSLTVQGSNALTLGTTGTNTGAIVFKGSTAASGTVILQGPNNPSTSNYTLSIPTLTANDTICTTNTGCGGASGTAGGDLTGTYPNPTIAKLQGTTLTIASIASGDVLQYNGSAVVNGHITNSNLTAGTFTSITGTGALTTGSIGSGFGTISTGNNITTSATVQGGTVNATTALQLGGADINTAGTLSNVAYLNQVQSFTAANTFSAAGTALSVTNNASIGGTLSVTTSITTPSITSAGALSIAAGGTNQNLSLNASGSGTIGIGGASTGDVIIAGGVSSTGCTVTNSSGNLSCTGVINTSTGNINATAGSLQTNSTTRIDVSGNATLGTITSGTINGQTIGSSSTFTGTLAVQGSNALTLGTTGTNTGAIVFKGSTAASGTVILQGPNNPSTSNYTLSIPTLTANDTICTVTLGNCAGTGGGVTGSGTTNTIALFTGSGTVGNSILTQSGTTINVGGALTATGALQGSTINGATVSSTAVNGLTFSGTAITGSSALAVTAGGTNQNLTLDASGSGQVLIGGNSTGDILLGGGSASTGCTVANATGNLTCSGNISTTATSGTQGWFSRSGTTLQPTNSGDVIQTAGSGGDTIALFTTSNGAYISNVSTAAGHWAFATQVSGDSQRRFIIEADGSMYWGSGSATQDTNLYRSAAGTLKTDNSLAVGTNLSVTGTIASGLINGQTISSSANLTGTLAVQGSSLTIGTAGTTAGNLNLANATNSNLTALQSLAPTGTGTATIRIPSIAGGSTDTVCLATLSNCTAAGAASGDLTGTYPNPTIAKLQGTTLTIASIASGDVLQYNGSAVVNGHITNSNLTAGTFTSITGTGALTTGSIGSGFGTISTGNNITTSATVQGNIVNATGVGAALQLGGTSINTAGTLSNVAYLNQVQSFTAANTFSAAGTALSVTNNASIGGTGTIGTLSVTNAATIGTGLTVTSGGLTVSAGGANITGGLTSAGTTTLSALNSAGVVHTNASGVLSTSAVVLGTDTTGNYIANLGTLTGLTTTGNSGAGSTPTLSVTYGSTANTAAQGNSALSFTGSGNLTGTVSGTAGGGLTTNTLALVNSPTFSGTLAVQGAGGITVGVAGTTAGTLKLANGTNSNLSILQSVAPTGTGNATYNLPAIAGGGSDTVCLVSLGNCGGAGSVTGSGTSGYLAKFNGSGSVTNSALSESGTTLTYGGNAIVNAANGFTGNLLNLQVNASSKYSVSELGNSTQAGTLTVNGTGSSSIAGTLTVANGLTVTTGGESISGGSTIAGGIINLNASSNYNTNINTGTSTGTVNIGNSLAGAVSLASANAINIAAGTASTISTAAGALTLQGGSGTVSLGTSTSLAANGALNVASGGSGQLTFTSATGTIGTGSAFNISNAGGKTTLQLSSTGSNTGLTLGGDTNLYRSTANVLQTDDALIVGGTSSTNTATAFQVQNASGTAALNIDTTNLQTTVRGGTDSATLGAELFSGSSTFTGTGWTITGTAQAASGTHTSGTTALTPSPALAITSGQTYLVSWTVNTPNVGSTLAITMGGQTLASYAFDSNNNVSFTDSAVITTSSTANLAFTPSTGFTGTVTAVSVKQVTANKSTLTVANTSGTASLEVRASSNQSNTFIGVSAGASNVSGSLNVALGTNSLQNNVSGGSNVALGYAALQSNTSGGSNVAIGANALQKNLTGGDNIAVGNNTLHSNINGYDNIALGYNALGAATTANYNIALGAFALQSVTTSGTNTGIGYSALRDTTTGYNNNSIGGFALEYNTTGTENTAFGTVTLRNNNGSQNAGFGDYVLANNTSGSYNTGIGTSTLGTNTTGSNNSALGAGADVLYGGVQNSTAIGANSQVGSNNSIILGYGSGGTINDKVGIGTSYATNSLTVNPNTYKTGTITQSSGSGSVVGSGTTFTSAMVGGAIFYSDGTTGTITAYTDATHVTSSNTTGGWSSASYAIVWGGFNVKNDASLSLQNTANSVSAFQIQNATGTALFSADTTNSRIYVGNPTADATGALLVLDTKNTSGDPVGVNGAMYYNSNLNAFRCYQNGAWTNCIGSGTSSLQAAYNGGNTINLATSTPIVVTAAASGDTGLLLKVASGNTPFVTFNNNTSAFGIRSDNNGLYLGPWDSASMNTFSSALTIGTNGATTLKNNANSATAFQVQNAGGQNVLTADTTYQRVAVGPAAVPANGILTVGTNSTTSDLGIYFGTDTNLYRTGSFDLTTNANFHAYGLFVQTAQNGAWTNLGTANTTDDIVDYFNSSGTKVGGVGAAGAALIKTSTNSTTAFQVQNSAGTSALSVDTTNLRVQVGTGGTPTEQLYVAGQQPSAAAGNVATSTHPWGLFTSGNYSYVINNGSSFTVYDTSNRTSPVLISTTTTAATSLNSLYVQGRYAYMVDGSSSHMYIYDVSNPSSPALISTLVISTSGANIIVSGRYAYIGEVYGKLQIIDIANPAAPVSKSVLQVPSGTATSGWNVAGMYLVGNYLMAGAYNGTTNNLYSINVANPSSPSVSGVNTTNTGSYYVYVQGRYAYTLNNTYNTLQIFDISNPAAAPVFVGSTAVGTGTGGGTGFPYAIFVQGRYAYTVNHYGLLYTTDISNPASPTVVGSTNLGGNLIDLFVQGNTAYVSDYTNSKLYTVDIGGAYVQQLTTGGTETGTLTVDGNTNIQGDTAISGGLTVQGATQLNDDIAVSGNAKFSALTNSTTAFQVQNAAGASLLTVDTQNGDILIPNDATATLDLGSNSILGESSTDGTFYLRQGNTSNKLSLQGAIIDFEDNANGFAHVFTVKNAGQATFQNATNSTTAFQVQNAAGTAALNVDTTNLTTTLQAGTDRATLGSELMSGSNSFPATTGWTSISGTAQAATATHTNGGGTTALSPSPALAIINGKEYIVSWTVNNPNAGSTLAITMGGQTLASYTFDGNNSNSFTDSADITTSSTANLAFTPSNGFTGTVTGVSAKQITAYNPITLNVKNTSGQSSFGVRGGSDANSLYVGNVAGGNNVSGTNNTVFGQGAFGDNTSGSANTAIGGVVLQNNTTGSNNVGLGFAALNANTSGNLNVAIGNYTLNSNIQGGNNVAVGTNAGQSGTSASNNTFVGQAAATLTTTGSNNVALGYVALYNNTTGINNTALGANALNSNVTGSSLTGVGNGSDVLFNNLSDATAVGSGSRVGASRTIVLGFGQVYGLNEHVGIGTSFAPNELTVAPTTYGTNGSAGTTSTIRQDNGTACNAGTTITGTGTTFTSNMVGGTIYYSDGTTALINGFTSTTVISSNTSKCVAAGSTYNIVYGGFNVGTDGSLMLQNTADSTAALKVQNAAGTNTLFNLDTTNNTVSLASTSTAAGLLNVTNNSAATNNIQTIQGNALTTGFALNIASTSTTSITSGGLLQVDGHNATTATGGLLQVNGSALTTGIGINVTANALTTGAGIKVNYSGTTSLAAGGLLVLSAPNATTSTGGILQVQANALTSGFAAVLSSTSANINSGGLLQLTANNATAASSGILQVSATGLTSGIAAVFLGGTNLGSGSVVQIADNAATNATNGILRLNGTSLSSTGILLQLYANAGSNAINLAQSGNIVNLASATANQDAIFKISTATTCATATAQGLVFQNTAGTQIAHICSTGANSTFYGTAFTASSTDVAENYSDVNNDLAPGDLVALDPSGGVKAITKADAGNSSNLFGVISTAPGVTLSGISEDGTASGLTNPKPVALTGRIPTNVNASNGSIAVGDYLTISSTPGVAAKATGAGMVIGRALEAYSGSGTGTIEVAAQAQYYAGPSTGNYIQNGGDASLSNLSVSGTASFGNLNASGVATIHDLQVQTLHVSGDLAVDGNLTVLGLAHVQDLQIDGHIITAGGQPTSQPQVDAGGSATVAVNGTDTTGTITITTGSNPTAGDLAKIIFSKTYGQAPHIVLSPSNDKAAGMRFFSGSPSSTDFMFNALDAPQANTTYTYEYFIAQ